MDATANQTLTPAEIAALPAGLTGAGVIAALEAASTSFAGKTEFSQARASHRTAWSIPRIRVLFIILL